MHFQDGIRILTESLYFLRHEFSSVGESAHMGRCTRVCVCARTAGCSPSWLFVFCRHCGYIKAKQDPDEEKMQFQHGRGNNITLIEFTHTNTEAYINKDACPHFLGPATANLALHISTDAMYFIQRKMAQIVINVSLCKHPKSSRLKL